MSSCSPLCAAASPGEPQKAGTVQHWLPNCSVRSHLHHNSARGSFIYLFPCWGGKKHNEKQRKRKTNKQKQNPAQSPMKNKPTGSWLICSEPCAPNIEQLADRECQESWCKDRKLSAWISCGTEQLISHTTETWGWTASRSKLPESLPSTWPPAQPPLWLFITFPVRQPSARNSGKGEQDLGNPRSQVARAQPFYSLFYMLTFDCLFNTFFASGWSWDLAHLSSWIP